MIEVHLRKKPDRTAWQMYYTDPLTGEEVTRSSKTPNYGEANRVAQRWQDELRKHGRTTNPSWETFRIRFMDEFAALRRPSTQAQYRAAFDWWERLVGSPKELGLILPPDISKFQATLATRVAGPTVTKTLRHLRAAFNWAETMGMIPRAPKISMPPQPRRSLSRSRAVTEAEYRAMLNACSLMRPADADDFRRLLELIWLSGLRLEEALRLSWEAPPVLVDLDGGRYPRIIFYDDGQKSGKDELWLMPPDFAEWLRQTPERRRTGLVAPVIKPDVDVTHISQIVTDIGRIANITTAPSKWASAHDLRRSFGTRWSRKVRPLTLQKLMRHASIETTMKFYVDHDESAVGEELYGDVQKTVPPTVPRAKTANGEKPTTTPQKKRKKRDSS